MYSMRIVQLKTKERTRRTMSQHLIVLVMRFFASLQYFLWANIQPLARSFFENCFAAMSHPTTLHVLEEKYHWQILR